MSYLYDPLGRLNAIIIYRGNERDEKEKEREQEPSQGAPPARGATNPMFAMKRK